MKPDKNQFRGALLGLACGDAVGTTVEFSTRGSFERLTDMIGGGPFGLKPGEWTDDTSMALCLAQSLLDKDGMDLEDQCERYLLWWKEGSNSVTGSCFDIGNTVRGALEIYWKTFNPKSGSTDPHSAGNGSIMRLAPVPMFFAADPQAAVDAAAESSQTTHGAIEAVDACKFLAALLVGAFQGMSKEELLDPKLFSKLDVQASLCDRIQRIADGSYREKHEREIRGTGYVIDSLEAALWAFHGSDSFENAILRAVNLGDDADTTGAVCGQIAGAHYGAAAIPKHWLEKLAWRTDITHLADQLYANASHSDA